MARRYRFWHGISRPGTSDTLAYSPAVRLVYACAVLLTFASTPITPETSFNRGKSVLRSTVPLCYAEARARKPCSGNTLASVAPPTRPFPFSRLVSTPKTHCGQHFPNASLPLITTEILPVTPDSCDFRGFFFPMVTQRKRKCKRGKRKEKHSPVPVPKLCSPLFGIRNSIISGCRPDLCKMMKNIWKIVG